MKLKRLVTIQDLSCFGKCSLTVALPIISACGIETAVIPTALLSTHTGGFQNYTFLDLIDELPKITRHWESLGLQFDAIYTGYLGSERHIEFVCDFIDRFRTENTLVFVDPAMGDNGSLYPGFDRSYALKMTQLCKKADVIVPNLTEAVFMLGKDQVPENCNPSYFEQIVLQLSELGIPKVLLTGASNSCNSLGVVYKNSETGEVDSYFKDRIPLHFHGTGDVFSSACVASLISGCSLKESAINAVDFTVDCIQSTLDDAEEHWYSVKFEQCLPKLIQRLQ